MYVVYFVYVFRRGECSPGDPSLIFLNIKVSIKRAEAFRVRRPIRLEGHDPTPLPGDVHNVNNVHMRRLLRIMFNALTLLSLLLCAASVALWVRSYGKGDTLVISHNTVRDEALIRSDCSPLTGDGALGYRSRRITVTGGSVAEYLRVTESSSFKSDDLGRHIEYCVNPTDWLERTMPKGPSPLLGCRWGSASATWTRKQRYPCISLPRLS